ALNYVIHVDVPEQKLIARLTGRRMCPTCGTTYHVDNNPPKQDGIRDKHGATLIQRDDDTKETIQQRLSVNIQQAKRLLDFYEKLGVLISVDGDQPIDDVFRDIEAKLNQ